MRSNQRVDSALPDRSTTYAHAKIDSERYAHDSDLDLKGLQEITERDSAVEVWLRQEVVAICDRLKADPSQTLTPEQLRQSLDTARKNRS